MPCLRVSVGLGFVNVSYGPFAGLLESIAYFSCIVLLARVLGAVLQCGRGDGDSRAVPNIVRINFSLVSTTPVIQLISQFFIGMSTEMVLNPTGQECYGASRFSS